MYKKVLFLVILCAFLGGCVATKLPSNLQNPQNFQIEKFTGLWYEIGKMKSPFEATLNNTTYEYFVDKNGTINLMKNGKFTNDKDFNEIYELRRVDLNNTASMKIESFTKDKFHNIVKVDDEYKYALIFGGDTSELYMLSRTKTMPEMIKAVYTSYAAKMGYNTDKIVWTTHE